MEWQRRLVHERYGQPYTVTEVAQRQAVMGGVLFALVLFMNAMLVVGVGRMMGGDWGDLWRATLSVSWRMFVALWGVSIGFGSLVALYWNRRLGG